MIKIFKFSPGHPPVTNLDAQEINKTLEDKSGFVWVSLENTNETEMSLILRDVFKFHPLAIEDCLSNGFQTPKLDDYGAYIFLVANALSQITDFHELASIEIDFFLGENFLVTSHMNENMPPLESVQKRIERDERLYSHGADFLCHAILDKLVDDFLLEHYRPGNQDGNWIEPAWEYMHGHPALDSSSLGKIRIWEDAGKIVPLTLTGTRYIDFLVPGLIALGIMMACMWGLSYSIIDKRSKKLLRRMLATPMRR
ncbi:MAG: hypothetical protein HGA86_01030, partial [Anaerolineaceae bacterium]|nr:hypothetical protein [Anaerolineaceae bacterium]